MSRRRCRFAGAALALALLPWPGAAAQTPAADSPFTVRTELSERRPWERSQVLYTVRVYRSGGAGPNDRIRGLDEPAMLGVEALVQRLGSDREYASRSPDSNFLVLERRYAIFPQSAGELLLMPVSLKWIGGEFGFRSRTFVADAEPERLQVRAVPSPPAGRWLAARDVRIWDEFERAPEELTAGEPLVRLLGVRVEGQPARQIPELDPGDGANFRHFIERPEFEDQVTRDGLVGVRRQRAALLALGGGQVRLPAIRIRWWNTLQERWETAELPQRSLQAQGPPAPAAAEPPAARVASARRDEWLPGILGGGWLLTAVAWWASHRILTVRRRRRELGERFARESAGPAAGQSEPLAELAAACKNGDAQGAEKALLAWSRIHFSASPPRSLNDLAERCGQPLSDHCCRLSAALYAPRSGDWDAAGLLKGARSAPSPPTDAPSRPSRGALPALWPENTAQGR